MLNSFICGSFHHQEDDEIHSFHACVSPKRSKRIGSFKFKENKNPYADRGLDKFDKLLAELDNKKQKIYTQKGAEDISLVRFVYSNDNRIKPVVVVKVKDQKRQQERTDANNAKEKHIATRNSDASEKHKIESPKAGKKELKSSASEIDQRPKKECKFKLEKLRQPSYLLPFITILILLFLAIYGRPFAILCTSIGWYLIPYSTKAGNNSTSGNPKKRKEYTRRLSDRKPAGDGSSSPTSVITGAADMSPRKHGHRKSF